MKKLLIAIAAVAAFGGSAMAADMAPRYKAAPMPMPVGPNWAGFYISGGFGGGIWDSAGHVQNVVGTPFTIDAKTGGDGWYGAVGAGYDWQFNSSWVFGIFADGQFGSLKGTIQDQNIFAQGQIKMQDAWAAGARLGYLVAPNVLSYVNAGYSGSHWSGTTLLNTFSGLPNGLSTAGFNRNGVFIGGGMENNLSIFGLVNAPGWTIKTEYRAAYYDKKAIPETFANGVVFGDSMTFKPLVQTITTSLNYRFNWTGPAVARY
jgi:outer membrane immunogenic protein